MRTLKRKRVSVTTLEFENDVFHQKPVLKKQLFILFISIISIYLVAWIFYESHLFCIMMSPLSLILLKYYNLAYHRKIKEEIEDEFSDLNRLIIAELEAKIPIEKALKNIEERIFSDDIYEFKHISFELKRWINELKMGLKLEDILIEFANRSEDQSFKDYAKMVSLSSKTGSKLYEVIVNTNQILQERKELKREISILVAEKKLEQRLMSIMPLLILIMLKSTAPDFIAPLYAGIEGRIIMTLVLGLFTLAYFWSKKLAELK